MKKKLKKVVVVSIAHASAAGTGAYAATVTKPYNFTANSVISSSEMNQDFDTLYTELNAKESRLNAIDGSQSANFFWASPSGASGSPVFRALTLTDLPTVPVNKGGTGLTSTPANGQILYGNGSGYDLLNLTAGSGISITNSGSNLTITNTGGGGGVSTSGGGMITSGTPTTVPLILRGNASQTANLFQVQNGGGTDVLTITSSGSVGLNNTSPGGRLHVKSISASETPLIVQATGSPSVPLTTWLDSSGTAIAKIDPTGGLVLDNRGTFGNAGLVLADGVNGRGWKAGVATSSGSPYSPVVAGDLIIQNSTGSPQKIYFGAGVSGAVSAILDSTGLQPSAPSSGTLGTSGSPWNNVYANQVNATTLMGNVSTTYIDSTSPMTINSSSGITMQSSGNMAINSTGGNIVLGAASPVGINQDLLPTSDNTRSLGSSGFRWAAVWSGNGTIQTSDARLKREIRDSRLGLDFVLGLRPVSYRWKTGKDSSLHYGFIAQEVESALGGKDQGILDYDPATDRYGMRYAELIAPTVRAVQELNQKVETLARENEQLKSQQVAQQKTIDQLKAVVCALPSAKSSEVCAAK